MREIKTVPYVPLSHPFVERLIGTVRREYLDRFYSGPRQTWRRSCSISNIILMLIARMLGWRADSQNRGFADLHHL